MPSSYSTFHPPNTYPSKNLRLSVDSPSLPLTNPLPEVFKPTFTPVAKPRELPRQRLPESFNLVTPLSATFSLRSDSSVSLYRARMENRNVVLRVLNGKNGITVIKGMIFDFLWHCVYLLASVYRHCRCHRKTQLPGLCILPGTARTTSFPPRASWCGLFASSSSHSRRGVGEQRPAQPPVAMQTGMFGDTVL